MIGCYLDESFDPGRRGVFAAGGLLGRGIPFFELERKWEALRKRPDIDIEYFKAFECEHGKGQFAKFVACPGTVMPEERDKLKAIHDEFLMLIVNEPAVTAFGVAVLQDEFYDVIKDSQALAILGDSPYWLAYHSAMFEAAWAMKKVREGRERRGLAAEGGGYDVVSYVYDQDEQYSPLARGAYDALRKHNPQMAKYMGSLSEADDKWCEPLQSADAVAYEIRKAVQMWSGKRCVPIRDQFRALAQNNTVWLIATATREDLLGIVAASAPGEPLNLDPFFDQEFPQDISLL